MVVFNSLDNAAVKTAVKVSREDCGEAGEVCNEIHKDIHLLFADGVVGVIEVRVDVDIDRTRILVVENSIGHNADIQRTGNLRANGVGGAGKPLRTAADKRVFALLVEDGACLVSAAGAGRTLTSCSNVAVRAAECVLEIRIPSRTNLLQANNVGRLGEEPVSGCRVIGVAGLYVVINELDSGSSHVCGIGSLCVVNGVFNILESSYASCGCTVENVKPEGVGGGYANVCLVKSYPFRRFIQIVDGGNVGSSVELNTHLERNVAVRVNICAGVGEGSACALNQGFDLVEAAASADILTERGYERGVGKVSIEGINTVDTFNVFVAYTAYANVAYSVVKAEFYGVDLIGIELVIAKSDLPNFILSVTICGEFYRRAARNNGSVGSGSVKAGNKVYVCSVYKSYGREGSSCCAAYVAAGICVTAVGVVSSARSAANVTEGVAGVVVKVIATTRQEIVKDKSGGLVGEERTVSLAVGVVGGLMELLGKNFNTCR